MARAARDELSGDDTGRRAVEAVWRIESARIVGALARYTGDFALAEDVASEALAEALEAWPRDGTPRDPVSWLLTVGRRRAIDAFRRRAGRDERYAALGRDLAEGGAHAGAAPVPLGDPDLLHDPDHIEDDRLALLFVACHPVLSREARLALTLRVVGGLTSEQVAASLLVPVPTVQARITRAKKALAAAGVPFAVPPAAERAERLGSVLQVVYLIFTEGSSASTGDSWLRLDLAHEAVRLARQLVRLVPEEPEAWGLLALLELTAARFPARTGPDGEPVLLADQDRSRWDRSAIRRGRAALARAGALGAGPAGDGRARAGATRDGAAHVRRGPYALQAAIAEQHAVAPSVDATDWQRIVELYEALARVAPSPVVDLNRAVAVCMAAGPEAALPLVDAVAAAGGLAGTYLVPSVRGELLARLGRTAEARAELEDAARLCGNARERAVLERKAAAVGEPDRPASPARP